jgi:hypothetical protein
MGMFGINSYRCGCAAITTKKLIVAENDIDLDINMPNNIFILRVEDSRGSAGGRAGGSGSRRIDRVLSFSCKDVIV